MNQCLCQTQTDAPCPTETESDGYATVEPYPLQPLSLLVSDRDGVVYLVDGRTDDTRVSLSCLDPVSKAGLRVILQEALREIDDHRTNFATNPGLIYSPGGWCAPSETIYRDGAN